jgi:wyosine [tRNA(Phe)-imidazoG37] synthetase (radical SAM superfamily)
MQEAMVITFGPVPSRRLGRSLGINNIPPKSCSYSCVYCQVGPTHSPEIEPRPFYEPQQIVDEVGKRLEALRQKGEVVDYLTFVPDGEPTLDSRLSEAIGLLRNFNIPIAVISNASLMHRVQTRTVLGLVDWVSVKVDTVDQKLWQAINRPHPDLHLPNILQGIEAFASDYQGTLCTETMLLRGLNDAEEQAGPLAEFLGRLKPDKAYLALPIRPPTESYAGLPDEATVNRVYQTIGRTVESLELLTAYEGDAFVTTDSVEDDILAIASVHPLRESALRQLLAQSGTDWQLVDRLIDEDRLVQTEYGGHRFFLCRLHTSQPDRRNE